MAIESIASIKSHFETGDRPTQVEFENLIDTLGRATPLAIASAAEGGKTGLYEILGDGDVTARTVGAFGREFISIAATASALNALGISSVQSIFLGAESTASSQSLLGISSHQATFLLSESTASSQSLLGGGTVGIAVYEAATTASAQDSMGVRGIVLGTPQATTSGTEFDFTGIPSWAKRITVMFEGVSLSGTDNVLVQIGDSGGVETTGYTSSSAGMANGSANSVVSSTSGFILLNSAAARTLSGTAELTRLDTSSNTWIYRSTFKLATTVAGSGGGDKTLSAALDRVRITRTGSNTFDAGSVNIMYEG